MSLPLNRRLLETDPPAVMEAWKWLEGVTHPADRPLMVFSQAAPAVPPPEPLRQALADIVLNDPAAHLYGPDLGLPDLRQDLAAAISRHYGGRVAAAQVAITAGANQAFTAAMTTLAGAGDEVLLPSPWYFNHAMHCQMNGIRPVPLPCGKGMLPDLDAAARLIGPATRALVLVTPNNPTGAEYPPDLLNAARDLCRDNGIALILDETYRDFHSATGAPHGLFATDWDDTLIHLYSFSKAYRLTGHRVGAVVTSAARQAEIEKYLDATTICANQLGQRAALWGLRHLGPWLAGEREEILTRRAAMAAGVADLPGWDLLGLGAYFAYVRHPFDMTSADLCKRLVPEAGLLLLPGSMFRPAAEAEGTRELRIAFANADVTGIAELFRRLGTLSLPRRA